MAFRPIPPRETPTTAPPGAPGRANQRARTRPIQPEPTETPAPKASSTTKVTKRRQAKPSKRTKPTREKRKPTGDYPNGYARTPEHSRFALGNPGGPGRPKGSLSQDSIKRREYQTQQTVTIAGRPMKLSQRELAEKLVVKKAIETKDTKLLLHILAEAGRLFPDVAHAAEVDRDASDSELDHQILRDLLAGLAMGEPAPDFPDPLSSLGITQPDLTANFADGDWDDGASAGETDDDD